MQPAINMTELTTHEARKHWQLNPHIDFLNHGSFGATPTCVLEEQRRWRDLMEADPIHFLAPERDLEPKLDDVRAIIAHVVGADARDLGFVRNATDGVNAVVRSLALNRDDQILVTNHGYNACTNAVHYAAERAGCEVHVAQIPFPISDANQVLDAIAKSITARTKLLLVDHVTSPTGLVFPIEEIVRLAQHHGSRTLVDGAHAPGMIPLNLNALGADYYTANHHKWLCGPKVSGFLWVRRELQHEVRPTVISHAANRLRANRSRFLAEFDWTGTFDPTPLLALPRAIEFLGTLDTAGLPGLMAANRQKTLEARETLTSYLGIAAPAPEEMIGSLATVPIAASHDSVTRIQHWLCTKNRFELPVFPSPVSAHCLIRISMQAYNSLDQVERLAELLAANL